MILAQLVERLPPADRDARLARQAADLQIAIDEVLVAIGVDVSTGLDADPTPRPARPLSARARKKRLAKWRADADALIAARDAAEEAAEAALSAPAAPADGPIAPIDTATVPGVIRAVLANDTAGLLPRQIIEAVRHLRPETDEAGVHGALHQMRKRGVKVTQRSLTPTEAGSIPVLPTLPLVPRIGPSAS